MRQVRRGSTGSEVEFLQTRMNALGFHVGRVDGNFGPRTEDAVIQFQASQGLVADGIVGARTWAAILSGPQMEVPSEFTSREAQDLATRIPEGTPENIRSVLHAAIRTLGWREIPNGSNRGPDVDKISMGYLPANQPAPPWCALAVSYWLLEGLGVGDYRRIPFGARFGAVSQIERWARSGNRLFVPPAFPHSVVGSIFTMGRHGSGSDLSTSITAGHTGLVINLDEDGNYITIEGNTSNSVRSMRRRPSTLRGLVMWW
jgi:hypothetical protein